MLKIFDEIYQNLKRTRVLAIVLIIIYAVAVIIGFVLGVKGVLLTVFENYVYNFIEKALSVSFSAFSFLFSRLFNSILILIPVFLCSLNRISLYLIIFIIFYCGFILGVFFKFFISGLGFSGLIFYIFTILLSSLITAISIIIYFLNAYLYYSCCNKVDYMQLLKYALVSLAILFLGGILELLILICILRPFNFYL